MAGTAALLLALLIIGCVAPPSTNAPETSGDDQAGEPLFPPDKVGLLVHDPRACVGYTLLAPSKSTNTYLIDLEGRVVHSWDSKCYPGLAAYLLENGHLLRAGLIKGPPFRVPGAGGRIQELTWDGQVVWDYTFFSNTTLPHHDICRMPNGNVLMIVWEKKSALEAKTAGRFQALADQEYLIADAILEVRPTGKSTGEIVWEWHAWDHLVQEIDEKRPNYGEVSAHPELIDLNFGEGAIANMVAKRDELKELRSIGYLASAGNDLQFTKADWLHINSVAYNAELDQIMLSVLEFSELWIIDHSTTKAEAAGHKGGRHGKGGDLLYRWGNPRAYRAGSFEKDERLFNQHDCHWIAKGLPGEGHVLALNNGSRQKGRPYSSADEIILPVDGKGHYAFTSGKAFGPEAATWSYAAPKGTRFYAVIESGAERLTNGNTLITSGPDCGIFEVTPDKAIVWQYACPIKGELFRAYRYPPNYPGLAGKELQPGKPIEGPPGHPGQTNGK
jgi:hypothetical protein